MIQEQEIRTKVEALLRREISIPDFSRWIVDRSWNMHRDSSQPAIDLASDVQILLAERNDRSLTDDDFLREIDELVAPIQWSVSVTSNRPVEDWGKLLGDSAAVTAMLDRLLHHGHVLKCGPRSWRTKTDLPPQEAAG
jgi:ribosomal protein RSM22 (predicted rRNA methylase)